MVSTSRCVPVSKAWQWRSSRSASCLALLQLCYYIVQGLQSLGITESLYLLRIHEDSYFLQAGQR